jgi:hypothetical protein
MPSEPKLLHAINKKKEQIAGDQIALLPEPLQQPALQLHSGSKKVLCASVLVIGPCDPSLLNWQQSLKECNIQSSRLEGKQINLLISSQSRLGKQVLQALVGIPVKRLHTLVFVMCNRHFRTFNGECFAPSLYYVYN